MAASQQPPIDVTETISSEPTGDAGRVLLDDLAAEFAAQTAVPTAHKNEKAVSAQTPEPAASTQPVWAPGPLAISAARAAQQNHGALKAGTPALVTLTCGPTDPIVLTAASDGAAGVITIPSTSQPPASAVEMPEEQAVPIIAAPATQGPQIAGSYQVWSQPSKKAVKKQIRHQKREQRRAQPVRRFGFVEFFDPDLERLDVDAYERQIVLTSGDDVAMPVPPESADAGDDSGEDANLFDRRITAIKPTLDFAWGDIKPANLPPNFFDNEMDKGEYADRVVPRTVLQWEPTNLWYHPVYFEDVGLERYGHSHRPLLQPFVSSGRFFGQVATLPYQMALRPASSREFALGYYQPGEWAPKKKYQLPFNEEAVTAEFLWITGLVLLIP